jgi:transposase
MAVTTDRVVGWRLVKGSVTSATFADFVQALDTDGRDTLLLDNASIHKTASVRTAVSDRALVPLFLPPYTPEFQPIEHCFNVLKTAYRQTRPRCAKASEADVQERVNWSMASLTGSALRGMFGACWRRAAAVQGCASVNNSPAAGLAPSSPNPSKARRSSEWAMLTLAPTGLATTATLTPTPVVWSSRRA